MTSIPSSPVARETSAKSSVLTLVPAKTWSWLMGGFYSACGSCLSAARPVRRASRYWEPRPEEAPQSASTRCAGNGRTWMLRHKDTRVAEALQVARRGPALDARPWTARGKGVASARRRYLPRAGATVTGRAAPSSRLPRRRRSRRRRRTLVVGFPDLEPVPAGKGAR